MVPKEKRIAAIEKFLSRPTLDSCAKELGVSRQAFAMMLHRYRNALKPDGYVAAVPGEVSAGLRQEG